jgi:hypothetical protein
MLRKKLPKQGFAFQLYTQGKALPLENHALLFCSLASALCLSVSVSLSMCLSFKSVLCLECFIGTNGSSSRICAEAASFRIHSWITAVLLATLNNNNYYNKQTNKHKLPVSRVSTILEES